MHIWIIDFCVVQTALQQITRSVIKIVIQFRKPSLINKPCLFGIFTVTLHIQISKMNIICNILTLIVKISQEIRIKYPTVKSIPPPTSLVARFILTLSYVAYCSAI